MNTGLLKEEKMLPIAYIDTSLRQAFATSGHTAIDKI